uniref:Uncharacterized protein n=1 Tax=Sphaerodactylus townsendi TaxID=933632 RepID=A0ACB8F132_9SAUR
MRGHWRIYRRSVRIWRQDSNASLPRADFQGKQSKLHRMREKGYLYFREGGPAPPFSSRPQAVPVNTVKNGCHFLKIQIQQQELSLNPYFNKNTTVVLGKASAEEKRVLWPMKPGSEKGNLPPPHLPKKGSPLATS